MTSTANPIIQLSKINMLWGNKQALTDVNLTVNQGDFLAVTGPNGGGKTTLLRIILKLLTPTSGNVTYLKDGQIVRTLPIGYLPQKNAIDSCFPISVKDVIESGLLTQKNISSQQKLQLVDETIKLVELEHRATYPIGALSGGQLQRALLGRALISRPEILVLDEPLSYLDKHFEERTYKIISDITPTTTIILVSHEMSVISTMANRHIIVDNNLHECSAHKHFIPTDCC